MTGRFSVLVAALATIAFLPDTRTAIAAQPEPAGPQAAAQQAIRTLSDEFVAAFNQGDARAVAAQWALEGEYVDEAGQRFVGREAIQKEYADFFAAHPGETIRITIDSLRLIGDTVAIEDGRSSLTPPPAGARQAAVIARSMSRLRASGCWPRCATRALCPLRRTTTCATSNG